MSQSFKLLFYLKKGKRCNVKSLPIYVRVTIDGERAEWSVQRNCEVGLKWNRNTGRATGSKEEVKTLNAYLDAIRGNIFAIQKEYAIRNEPITAEQVRSKILHKSEEKQHTLVEVYKYHNDQFERLVGVEFSNGTFKRFKSALKSLESFIKWKFNKKDVYLTQVNHKFITDYEFYLKCIQKLQHNSAPLNTTVEVAGPVRMPMYEFIRYYLEATEDSRQLVADEHALYFGTELNDELVPIENPRLGKIKYEDWFNTQLVKQ